MRSLLAMLVLLPVMTAQEAAPSAKADAPANATPRADPLDAMVADSPFLPGNGGRGVAATSTGPLELRSVVFVDGAYQFSIFDQGTNKAEWVRIGERGYPFVARSFNRERDALTVEHQGRTLVLALQAAKMASAGAPQQQSQPPLPGPGDGNRRANQPPATGISAGGPNSPPPGTPNAGATGNQAPPPGTATSAEAQRLQNLADEIRRRRGSGQRPLNLPQN